MARRFTKGIDLVNAQRARFAKMAVDHRAGHYDIAKQGYADAKELTNAPGVRGKARVTWLRREGHPLGRGASAAKRTSTGRRRGTLNALPVGVITGKLYSSLRLTTLANNLGGQSYSVGPKGAGKSLFRLIPGGTNKLVDSGYWKEIKRRWKARNQAFIQHYVRKQRTP